VNREQIIQNTMLFDSFLGADAAQREFHRSVIKNGKKFVAFVAHSRIFFIPGHYAIVPTPQLRALVQKQTISGHVVDRRLSALCGAPLSRGEPLYDQVDGEYVSYCALSNDKPSAHHQDRIYWMLRPPN